MPPDELVARSGSGWGELINDYITEALQAGKSARMIQGVVQGTKKWLTVNNAAKSSLLDIEMPGIVDMEVDRTPIREELKRATAGAGRSWNIGLVLATQYAKDLMAGAGRTVDESCSTKVILYQDPSGQEGGSDLTQQIFGLSEQEKAYIERADKGFGILFTEQGKVPFYNRLTSMECNYFTTKPGEVARN